MSDLIERQAAIDALYHVDEYNGRSVAAIRNLPSAQPDKDALDDAYAHGYTAAESEFRKRMEKPERKKGKWIRHAIGHENVPWGFDCSACNKWFVIGEDTADQYNFCPNCGVLMRGTP